MTKGVRQDRAAGGALVALSVGMLFVSLIAAGPSLLTVMDGPAYVALVALSLLAAVPLVRAARRAGPTDYMAPIYLFTLWFVLDYGIAPVWALFNLYNPAVSLEPA